MIGLLMTLVVYTGLFAGTFAALYYLAREVCIAWAYWQHEGRDRLLDWWDWHTHP